MNLKINRALAHINSGGIISYPTEAVWGLGCDPFNLSAVRGLLAIKQRDINKGLVLVASESYQVDELLKPLGEKEIQRLKDSWPGPFTWVLPDPNNFFPPWIKGNHNGVAVRVSAHPVVRALCDAWGGLLVSTSANIAGRPAIRTSWQVLKIFGPTVFQVPGKTSGLRRPSRIRDILSNADIRS